MWDVPSLTADCHHRESGVAATDRRIYANETTTEQLTLCIEVTETVGCASHEATDIYLACGTIATFHEECIPPR
jgi:hypothetical protein